LELGNRLMTDCTGERRTHLVVGYSEFRGGCENCRDYFSQQVHGRSCEFGIVLAERRCSGCPPEHRLHVAVLGHREVVQPSDEHVLQFLVACKCSSVLTTGQAVELCVAGTNGIALRVSHIATAPGLACIGGNEGTHTVSVAVINAVFQGCLAGSFDA
jgi:hypothetical protein